jgi:hypothetical protein
MMKIQQLRKDPAVRGFVFRIIQEAMTLDPVDALHDIELALTVWREHVDEILR